MFNLSTLWKLYTHLYLNIKHYIVCNNFYFIIWHRGDFFYSSLFVFLFYFIFFILQRGPFPHTPVPSKVRIDSLAYYGASGVSHVLHAHTHRILGLSCIRDLNLFKPYGVVYFCTFYKNYYFLPQKRNTSSYRFTGCCLCLLRGLRLVA